MEHFEIMWKSAKKELETTVSTIAYSTYVTKIEAVDLLGDKLILCTPIQMFADYVNLRIRDKVLTALKNTNSAVNDYVVVVANNKEDYDKQVAEGDIEATVETGMPINPKFTFDSFVVGSCNDFMVAAAKAVAENPGESYNPLFIYGGTGLGKTHILMAIANHIRRYKPQLNVLYATCEQFTNQLIDSISRGKGTGNDFRRKYRNVDVLIIDDIQFLAQKQGIQREFFHTFNELVMQNKQIVLSSDRPPKEIEVLEDRLRTRFEGGLLADVQPPSLETRIAILRKKSEEQKCLMDIKVLGHLAEMDDGDIRSLIGKLTKVIFFSKLHERPITVSLVDEALKESVGERKDEMEVSDIIDCVCNFYKINKNDLVGKKKNKEFVEPRQICMYIITDMLSSIPLHVVGGHFGKDHSTVIYSRDKIAEQMKTDSKMSRDINDIKKMLLKQ